MVSRVDQAPVRMASNILSSSGDLSGLQFLDVSDSRAETSGAICVWLPPVGFIGVLATRLLGSVLRAIPDSNSES